jgi:hypothetical protein
MGNVKYAYKILVGKSRGNISFARRRYRLENSIKIVFKEDVRF